MFLKTFTTKLLYNKIIIRKLNPQDKSLHTGIGPLNRVANYDGHNDNRNDEGSIEPISLFNIKKTIKSFGNELTDGFCCLRTTCPACYPLDQQSKIGQRQTNDIYINKTTGQFPRYQFHMIYRVLSSFDMEQ